MTSIGQESPSVSERLHRAGISDVVVIDNTFDTPSISDLVEGELEIFWSAVTGSQQLCQELEELGIETGSWVDDLDERDEKAFDTLWQLRDDGSEIAKAATEHLFGRILEDQERTNRIVELLETLELGVATFGKEVSEPPSPVKLVFLDYYLGSIGDKLSKDRASRVARHIYGQFSDPVEKPFFVLMSSVNDVAHEADQFRRDSGLLGGLFDFVTKEDLMDHTMLSIKLASWAAGMPDRHKIQSFVETLESSLAKKSREFMEEVKSLTFDDYAFIQALSLESEGQPLGNYMISLFGSLIVNSILENNDDLLDSRKQLDKMSFTSFVPSQRAPSNHLARIYGLSVAEPIREGITHPLQPAEDDDWLPQLRLGDIWVKDSKSEVYMVANPDCDLAFGPGGRRHIDKDLSVLLIPGHLVLLEDSSSGGDIRTDLFQIGDEKFRIHWEPKRIVTVKLRNFRKDYSDGEYSRHERLRLPYALRIQQALTSHVSQVGVPVAPPLYERVSVRFFADGHTAGWEQLGESVENGAAVVFTGRNKGSVVVTTECIQRLLKLLPSVTDRYRQERETADNQKRRERLSKKIADLESCQKDPRHLLAILEKTWEIPSLGATTELESTVVRLHNRRKADEYCSDHYICLEILYPPQVD